MSADAGMPRALIEATVAALAGHAPYDRMDRATLEFLAASLSLAYFPKGSVIALPADGAAATLRIIQRGRVRGIVEGGADAGDIVEYAEGDSFPLAAIMAARPVRHVYAAEADCFCYEAPAAIVATLVARSPAFHAFCTGRVSALLERSWALLQAQYAERSLAHQPLGVPLGRLLRREPVACAPETTLGSALATMRDARVGAIVVADAARVPLGIFTERDLLRIAAAGEFDAARPMRACMSAPPRTLGLGVVAAEAAVLMAQAGIRHVVVVDDGNRLAGVVSERDLFALQRESLRGIVEAIAAAGDEAALVQAAAAVRSLAGRLLAQGLAAEQVTRLIATLNDRLVARILEREAEGHDLGGIALCWIALGSEGRMEQTLATDQDNGLVFRADMPATEARERLLPFARAANRTLDRCGFPLCRGDIMAGNPQWCLEASGWQETFDGWIRNPVPEALLNSNIFHDFRPVWGDAALAEGLRAWLRDRVRDDQRFLRAMAANAARTSPPLGLFADFLTSAGEAPGAAHTIDLKGSGARLFVDAARILALAAGIVHTGTAERLRAVAEAGRLPRAEADAMVEAFHYIQLLRLRHQQAAAPAGGEDMNRIDPRTLNDLDRRVLKEAFRQARRLQRRVALDFQL